MFVEFTELNIKLLILLIFPIFNEIEDYTKKEFLIKDNQLFKIFRYFMSYIIAGVFLIIYKIRNRQLDTKDEKERLTSNDDKNEQDVIENIVKKKQRKRNIINIIFIIALCGIGFFCQFYRKLFEKSEYKKGRQSILVLFDVVIIAILNNLVLHQKLYKHHFISLGIMVVILLTLFILFISFIKLILETIIYYFFYALLFIIYDIIKKIYMNIYYYTPYFIMFIIGLINVILILIFDIIAYFTNPDISGIIIGFKDNINSASDVFWLIFSLIAECIWNLGFWLTIYYFTPCHIFISEFLYQFILYIIDAAKGGNEFYSTMNIIFFSIGYFINLCCILIFNEVIILNFCGLDYNTKKRIEQREKDDSNINNMIHLKTLSSTNEEEENN